jgi:hypothetical protein
MHYRHFKDIGPNLFSKEPLLNREQYVYDALRTRHWKSLNSMEQQHARAYIRGVGGKAWAEVVSTMTEEQAKQVALDFVAKSNLDHCEFDSIQHFPDAALNMPGLLGDEWVVRFAFELPDDVACSSEAAIVLVDDATGEPRLLESL